MVGLLIYLLLIICLIILIDSRKEQYDYEYNYYKENPNATVSGKNISGTVYASYPDQTGGLGWIL